MYKQINIVVLLFIGFYVHANNIFVATNGSNSNSGTISFPYKTITYAATQANPGDIVYVRAGIYTNTSFGNGSLWNNENVGKIVANGTEDQYITFKPYNNEQVTIYFDGTYGILIKDSSYINLVGFEVKGMSESITQSEAWANWGIYKNPDDNSIHNLATELGIDPSDPSLIGQTISKPSFTFNEIRPAYYNGRGIVVNNSHHIEITNNIVHHCPQSGIRSEGSDYVTVSQNEVYANTYYTSAGVGALTFSSNNNIDTYNGIKMIIDRNKVYDNENRLVSWNGDKDFITFKIDEGSGIFLTRNNDSSVPLAEQYQYGFFLIRNNVSYRNGASGIVIHKTNKTIVENNTCYKNGNNNDGNPGGIGFNTVDDLTIRNNISYARTNKFALGVVGLPANNVKAGYNILFNENGTEPLTEKMSSTYITNYVTNNGGWLVTDPLFMDTNSDNFHLVETSPAIDYGTLLSSATVDFDGSMRNNIPDAGAYEYWASVSYDENKENLFMIYPNPSQGILFFNSEHFFVEIEMIQLFDMLGRKVKDLNISENNAVDVSDLNKGIYQICILLKNKSKFSQRVVLE